MSAQDDAYRKAAYRILCRPEIWLHIDDSNPALKTLYSDLGHWCGCFVTASNPRSRQLRETANQRRHRALKRALDTMPYPAIPAEALDPHGCWPVEVGVWIGGIPLSRARQLARQFGQNAIVYAGPDTVASLVYTTAF